MGPDKFNVIFTGQLKEGQDAQAAAKLFAEKFSMPLEKATKIIQANRNVVIKTGAEHVNAYKLKSLLESFGMIIRLQRAALVPEKPVAKKVEKKQRTDKPVTANKSETLRSEKSVNNSGSADWSLEPIEDKNEEESEEPINQQAVVRMPTDKKHSQTFQKERDSGVRQEVEASKDISAADKGGDFFKSAGLFILGGLALLLLFIKKFGLFKLLKIGALTTFASSAVFSDYDADMICMGNDACKEAVEDQMDSCWEDNGFDDYDWDNMSDDAYFALKPKIEKDYIGCFRYENSNDRVFISPIELRIDLMSNCELLETGGCYELVEPQIKACYDRHNIGYYVDGNTKDFYTAVEKHKKFFKEYYVCYKDKSGNPLFQSIIDDWDYHYSEEEY